MGIGGFMQKWEYCVITGIDTNNGFSANYPKLYFFGTRGISKTVDLSNKASSQRPEGMRNVTEGGYIASIIALLGQEGWEMVGEGHVSLAAGVGYQSLYFKRQIE